MARSRPYLHQSPPRLSGSGAFPVHDDSGNPLIRMQTLGAATVLVGEARLSAAAGTLFSLLVRVVCAPGMLLGRDVLLRALWPEQDEVRQRANLRQALYKLRSYGVRIGLHGDVVQLDVSQVIRTFSMDRTSSTFEHDVTLGHEPFGAFLAGFSVPWPEYQEWLNTEREAVHADVRRVLAGELHRRRERADWGGADALARWLLQFDPLNEEATLTIAECTALSGSKSEAVAILDRYLAELGPHAGDIRLPATMLRRRIAEPVKRGRVSFAPTERHFIGREEELAELTLAMRRARWHDGSGVLLHGAPGIGKTRLANELEKVAVIEGIRVSSVSCRESDVLRPLSVFVDMLPEWLTHSGALGCDPSSLLALRRLVPTDQRQALFPSLPVEVRDVPSVSIAKDPTGDSAESGVASSDAAPASYMTREPLPMMSALRRALIDLLSAISDERPMLLVIDDVHWIDEHSWDVLTDLVDRSHLTRIFLLITSREAHARPEPPQRSPLALTVRALPPLSPDSCELLTRAIGDDLSASASDELVLWFSRSSEGNPLFLRALVNHWIETGEAGGVPPTLRGVIEQRLSQLSADALRVLQTAALLGKWATSERVMGVLELPVKDTLHAMDELSKVGALRDVSPNTLEVPTLLRQVVESNIRPSVRALLSFRIAQALRNVKNLRGIHCEIETLEHFVHAGRIEDACAYYSDVVPELLNLDASHRALALTRAAIGVVPHFQESLPLKTIQRDVLFSAGQYSRLLRDHEWTNGRSKDVMNWDRLHALDVVRMVEIADRSMFLGDYNELCSRGLLIARSEDLEPHVRMRASIAVLRASAMGVPRHVAESAFAIGQNIASALNENVFARREIAMYFHTPFGDLSESNCAARSIAEDFESAKSLTDRTRLLGDCGFALMCGGDLVEAGRIFHEALVLAVSNTIHSRAVASLYHLSHIALLEGGNVEAMSFAQKATEMSQSCDDPFLIGLSHRNTARIALLTGDVSRAVREYDLVKNERKVASHPKWRAFDIALRLGLALAENQPENVLRILPSAVTELDALKAMLGQDFLASRVILAQRMTDSSKAKITFDQYLGNFRREAYPVPDFLKLEH